MVRGEYTVWCLLGHKAGDNTQVRALAEELGTGYSEKHISARPWELLTHLSLGASLAGINTAISSDLQPPWPDLVISAGRRNEPVARWIRKQSRGQTRLVHIGRPWAAPENYDLLITTPQYFLPAGDNVLLNQLPLSGWKPQSLDAAAQRLRPGIAHLPRPWIVLLIGGDSGKFVFTRDKGQGLGEAAVALAQRQGGSLLVADSPRTSRAAGDAVQAQLRPTDYCYRWGHGSENPYLALLALADAFVVTGESMSMLAEATAMEKPIYIFDIGDGDRPWWRRLYNFRYKPLSHHLAMLLAPLRMRRDVGKIQQALVSAGRASWLTETGADAVQAAATGAIPAAITQQELRASAAAVRRLLAESS